MADYSIWVLEYAAVELFPFSVMMYGPQHQGTRKLPYAYVLLKGKGETILIDTGYDHVNYGKTLADAYGVSNYHAPREVLAECGKQEGVIPGKGCLDLFHWEFTPIIHGHVHWESQESRLAFRPMLTILEWAIDVETHLLSAILQCAQ